VENKGYNRHFCKFELDKVWSVRIVLARKKQEIRFIKSGDGIFTSSLLDHSLRKHVRRVLERHHAYLALRSLSSISQAWSMV
jgi:hypothetical protein